MQLQEMDSMLAWDCMQQLLQDNPDILGNLELHTFVQPLHSVHTSANVQCKSVSNCTDTYPLKTSHYYMYPPALTSKNSAPKSS
jgi:hypothetical protein